MTSKTIIVTGAGRGIGLAISKYLLEKSHKVVLVARTESDLEALKKQYPTQVEYVAADLSDFDVRTLSTGNCLDWLVLISSFYCRMLPRSQTLL